MNVPSHGHTVCLYYMYVYSTYLACKAGADMCCSRHKTSSSLRGVWRFRPAPTPPERVLRLSTCADELVALLSMVLLVLFFSDEACTWKWCGDICKFYCKGNISVTVCS